MVLILEQDFLRPSNLTECYNLLNLKSTKLKK